MTPEALPERLARLQPHPAPGCVPRSGTPPPNRMPPTPRAHGLSPGKLPKAYPPEFPLALSHRFEWAKPVREATRELGIRESCLHTGVSTEHAKLAAVKRRIRQLETGLEVPSLPERGIVGENWLASYWKSLRVLRLAGAPRVRTGLRPCMGIMVSRRAVFLV